MGTSLQTAQQLAAAANEHGAPMTIVLGSTELRVAPGEDPEAVADRLVATVATRR